MLFRIFDIVKNDTDKGSHKEWMDTTCNHTLYAMTDVFNEFFDKLSPILLTDLLDQFRWCLVQENDQLSKSAVSCLENLVLTNRISRNKEVLVFMSDVVGATLMQNQLPPGSQATTAKSMKHRLMVHLELIASVRRYHHLSYLTLSKWDAKYFFYWLVLCHCDKCSLTN